MPIDITSAYTTAELSEPKRCSYKSCHANVATSAVICTTCLLVFHPTCAVKAKVANDATGSPHCLKCQAENNSANFVIPSLPRSKSPTAGHSLMLPTSAPMPQPPPPSNDISSLELRDILADIRSSIKYEASNLRTAINDLSTNVVELSAKINGLDSRVTRVETVAADLTTAHNNIVASVTTWSDKCTASENQIRSLVSQVQVTCLKATKDSVTQHDLENSSMEDVERVRRNGNIIIYGLPEPPLPSSGARKSADFTEAGRVVATICPDLPTSFMQVNRIGAFSQTQARPRGLRVQLGIMTAAELLTNAFRSITPKPPSLSGLSITRDRTPLQQRQLHSAIKELDERKKSGEENLSLSFSGSRPRVVAAPASRPRFNQTTA